MLVEPVTTLTLIGTAAAQVSAIIGLGTAVHGFIKHLTKTNAVSELRKELLKTRLNLSDVRPLAADEFLEKFLTHGSVIAAYVRRRMVGRLVSAVIVIVSAQLVGFETRALSPHDTLINFAQAFIQIGAGFITSSVHLLLPDEKTFFRNLEALETVFYERYILATVVEFNNALAKATEESTYNNREEWRLRMGVVSREFHHALEKSEFETGGESRLVARQ